MTGLGKTDEHAVMRKACGRSPDEQCEQGADYRGERREVDPADAAVRCEAWAEHSVAIDSQDSKIVPGWRMETRRRTFSRRSAQRAADRKVAAKRDSTKPCCVRRAEKDIKKFFNHKRTPFDSLPLAQAD
jgi:hypothetical protein